VNSRLFIELSVVAYRLGQASHSGFGECRGRVHCCQTSCPALPDRGQ